MISSPEECGYDVSDGHTGNVTGGMAEKMQPAHIVKDPKRTGSVTDRSIEFIRKQTKAGKPFYAQVSYYAVHCARIAQPHWISIRRREPRIGLIRRDGPECLKNWIAASAGSLMSWML